MKIRPPVLAIVCFAVAKALDLLIASPKIINWPLNLAGLVLALVGLGLGAWALRTFHRSETTHDPFGAPSTLVKDGPYRFSRNPMYVGLTLVLFGAAVYFGSLVMFLAPVAFVLVSGRLVIAREEKLLAGIFGRDYQDFRRRVRRWL